VHLVGFITKKFVTMHGQMNVKKICLFVSSFLWWKVFQSFVGPS